jgi:hypothetical protein
MAAINMIVTHCRPHLDEILAIFLLERYGERRFPNVRQAIRSGNFEFWDAGSPTPDGRSAEAWEADGTILIGVGQGRFDEHPALGVPRKEGQTAASLVAEALHCSRQSEVRQLLEYAISADLNGDGHYYGLERLVQIQHDHYPKDPIRVMRWTMDALRGIVGQQLSFHRDAAEALAKAQGIDIGVHEQNRNRLVVAETDVRQLKARAMSKLGWRASAVIQRDSNGNVQLFVRGDLGIDLVPIARAIADAELEAQGLPPLDEAWVPTEGKLQPQVPWHFFPKGNCLLNGSLTSPNTPPTAIDWERLVDITTEELRKQLPQSVETPA